MPPKKKNPHASTGPAKKTLRISKKAFIKDSRPPGPGERKAFRKRLVLSNTNTPSVELADLSRENMLQKAGVVGIPGTVVDSLRTSGAFKVSQGWSNYSRPAFLLRDEARDLAATMADIESSKKDVRQVVHGDRKTGKSAFLLQAMTMAFLRDWIVFSIPECK
jgi:small subunit ribosomal protein S29